MNSEKNTKLDTSELVAKFLELALAQHEAVETFQTARYNRLYDRIELIKRELKAREGDQRMALLPLLEAPNIQVRFMAAYALLTIAPEQVRKTLIGIRETGQLPQSADASYTLDNFEESIEKFKRFDAKDN
ncbi:DUF2019 domain-containing protein [Tardiphaga sp.]|jgi:hypothetical protein|uniref:DUF2019 domain-containing protein n=1 Tax=Tardiphaga sp. TaxID=1926292 RepID=UPI0037DA605E